MWAPVQHTNNSETKDYFVKTTDIQQVLNDQIGKFPVMSGKGSQYCFVMYLYDTNAILICPIRNRSAKELLYAYKKL